MLALFFSSLLPHGSQRFLKGKERHRKKIQIRETPSSVPQRGSRKDDLVKDKKVKFLIWWRRACGRKDLSDIKYMLDVVECFGVE